MEELKNELREKMMTMGEVATVLAHEIKNPMNSIIINLEVLKGCLKTISKDRPSDASDKADKYLGVIEGEMKRLDKVIKSFLDLASNPQTTKHHFSMNLLIQNVMEFMKIELSQNNIELELNLNPDLPRLTGSSDQLKQAILNLILNASQAMPKGGKVIISTDFDEKTLFVNISDTGPGIDDKIRSQIFSPYFTTKEKGSGLGLAIVRRIVRDHGGYIDVESTAGEGACFSLVFPRKTEAS